MKTKSFNFSRITVPLFARTHCSEPKRKSSVWQGSMLVVRAQIPPWKTVPEKPFANFSVTYFLEKERKKKLTCKSYFFRLFGSKATVVILNYGSQQSWKKKLNKMKGFLKFLNSDIHEQQEKIPRWLLSCTNLGK